MKRFQYIDVRKTLNRFGRRAGKKQLCSKRSKRTAIDVERNSFYSNTCYLQSKYTK